MLLYVGISEKSRVLRKNQKIIAFKRCRRFFDRSTPPILVSVSVNIRLTVKFRAFGITFGTVTQDFPIGDILAAIAKNLKGDSGAFAAMVAGGLVDNFQPHVWLDRNGVKLELIK